MSSSKASLKKKSRSSFELYQLKQDIKKLESRRSFNGATCLITFYIKPDSNIHDVTQTLREEQGTAVNIKDKNTGKAVQSAISSILSQMKNIRRGENGLVLFAGMTQLNKIEFFAVHPPEPVGIKQYICDSIFHTEHLREMLKEKERYGFIVIDRGAATFAVVQGAHMKVLLQKDSFVPSKHGRGGQSQARIERGIEIIAQEWFQKMAEKATEIFIHDEPISGLVIGGPAMSKDEFVKNKALDYRLKKKLLGVFDLGYTGRQGLKDLQKAAASTLADVRIVQEEKIVERFMSHLGKDTGLAAYGENEVRQALEAGAVDILMMTDDVDRMCLALACESCGTEFKRSAPTGEPNENYLAGLGKLSCPQCKGTSIVLKSETDLVEELGESAEASGTTVEIISADHEGGSMLSGTFRGITAILRYAYFGQ